MSRSLNKILVLPAMLLSFGASQAAHAKDYTVNVFDDPTPVHMGANPDNGCDSGGRCSLREAVLAASVNGDASSVIHLPAGTYALTIPGSGEDMGLTGDLDVKTHSLTLTGDSAANTFVNASGMGDRVIDTHFNGGNSLTLNNLTLQGGAAPASDVFGGGAVRIGGVPIAGDLLTINNCNISGNSVAGSLGGGGLFIGDNAVINNSTISNNTASGGSGGGILLSTGVSAGHFFKMNNSTISGNHSARGGGIWAADAILLIRSSTIFNNAASVDQSGGIFLGDALGFSASLQMRNSILAGNSAATGSKDCGKTAGSVVPDSQFNLYGDIGDCPITNAHPGDQVNVSDPKLEALGDYGGPTPTLLLKDDSPALDTGSPSSCLDADGNPLTQDQRGKTRPVGANCDIGAVELNPSDQPAPNNGGGGGGGCALGASSASPVATLLFVSLNLGGLWLRRKR